MNRESVANWVLLISLVAAWLPIMPFIPGTRAFALATVATGLILAATGWWAFVTQRSKNWRSFFDVRFIVLKTLVGIFGAGLAVWSLAQALSLPA